MSDNELPFEPSYIDSQLNELLDEIDKQFQTVDLNKLPNLRFLQTVVNELERRWGVRDERFLNAVWGMDVQIAGMDMDQPNDVAKLEHYARRIAKTIALLRSRINNDTNIRYSALLSMIGSMNFHYNG